MMAMSNHWSNFILLQPPNGWRYPLGVGRDNAILTEPTLSKEQCLKTGRVPQVGCEHCWAVHTKYFHRNHKYCPKLILS